MARAARVVPDFKHNELPGHYFILQSTAASRSELVGLRILDRDEACYTYLQAYIQTCTHIPT